MSEGVYPMYVGPFSGTHPTEVWAVHVLPVSEPATATLLLAGASLLVLSKRRR